MRRAWLLALAGCYQPTIVADVPCGPGGACPRGQRCVEDVCRANDFVDPDALARDASLDDDAATDGAPPIDASQIWAMPMKIPGVNTASSEDDPSFTPDRLTIAFTSNRNGTTDVFLGTRAAVGDAFTVAPLAIVNSAMGEESPEISADGNTLYFTSNRTGNFEVYVAQKVGGAFGMPVVVTELSSAAADRDVAVSPDGRTALLARDNDMFIATRASTTDAFSQPVLVPELDVAGNVAAPSLTDGADVVYLHAGTTRDLYVAFRQGSGFSMPVPIAELNTTGRDAAPFVAPDDRHLAFSRDGELFESSR